MIRVGFFRNFKGSDSVLIDADHKSMAALQRLFSRLASGSSPLDITAESDVIRYRNIALLAELSETNGRVRETTTGLLKWSGTSAYWTDAEAKIVALCGVKAGHQYLVEEGAVQVVVSLGEYGADWWAVNGNASET